MHRTTIFPKIVLAAMLFAPWIASAAEHDASGMSSRHVDYVVVVTGGELLRGVYADGHTYFVTRTLRPLGLRCVGSLSVDDRAADIRSALEYATRKAPLVIVTGGLGPTDNDLTRETLSDFTGIPLHEDEAVLTQMEKRFRTTRDRMRANLRRQARVPVRGGFLANAGGTAVGLVFESPQQVVVALPGPPRELQPMVRVQLIPYLAKRFGTSAPGPTLTTRFVGAGQSQINQTMDEQVTMPEQVTMLSQFETGRVDFSFSLPEDTPVARRQLDELREQLLACLGDYIYGFDDITLEQTVLERLRNRGETIVIAEVGSGGAVAAALAGTEGCRGVLRGAFVAPTEDDLVRLLNDGETLARDSATTPDVSADIAHRVAENTGADWALVVGAAKRTDEGAHLCVVIRLPSGLVVQQQLRTNPANKQNSFGIVTNVLALLRKQMLKVSG